MESVRWEWNGARRCGQRANCQLGVFRSWDGKYAGFTDDTGPEDHWMVIIDNMVSPLGYTRQMVPASGTAFSICV